LKIPKNGDFSKDCSVDADKKGCYHKIKESRRAK